MIDLEADAAPSEFSEESLRSLAELARTQLDLEERIKEAEDVLKGLQDRLFRVSGVDIPTKMDEIGVSDFLLKSGERVKVVRGAKASIPKARLAEAIKWLTDNGAGSLVKTKLQVDFGREEMEEAQKLCAELNDRGLDASSTMGVHPMTLSAYVREQMEQGVNLPADVLGIIEYATTKITAPKK